MWMHGRMSPSDIILNLIIMILVVICIEVISNGVVLKAHSLIFFSLSYTQSVRSIIRSPLHVDSNPYAAQISRHHFSAKLLLNIRISVCRSFMFLLLIFSNYSAIFIRLPWFTIDCGSNPLSFYYIAHYAVWW